MINPLPKGVEVKNGKYQYRYYIPIRKRATTKIQHDAKGRAPRVILCPITAPDSIFYSALSAVQEKYELQTDPDYLTVGWLHKKWEEHIPAGNMSGSRAYRGLAKSTQKRYKTAAKILNYSVTIDHRDIKLRHFRADSLSPPVVRRILDERYLKGIGTSNLNNELAMLGSMYKYAKQYLPEVDLKVSPTRSIEKFKTNTSDRYVTDQEYNIQFQIAHQINRSYLPDYMELTYLLAARGCEVSTLKIKAASHQGIIVTRTKGSLNTGIRWTPRLKRVWNNALARHQTIPPDQNKNIIVTEKGSQITKSTIDDAWGLVRDEMKKRGLHDLYFTAHALKFKGISDAQNKALAGQSEAMQMRYKVNVDWFDAPQGSEKSP